MGYILSLTVRVSNVCSIVHGYDGSLVDERWLKGVRRELRGDIVGVAEIAGICQSVGCRLDRQRAWGGLVKVGGRVGIAIS